MQKSAWNSLKSWIPCHPSAACSISDACLHSELCNLPGLVNSFSVPILTPFAPTFAPAFAFALAIILSFASQEILPTPKVRMCLSSHVATLSVLRSGSVTTDKIVILPSYVSLPEDQHNQDLWPAKAWMMTPRRTHIASRLQLHIHRLEQRWKHLCLFLWQHDVLLLSAVVPSIAAVLGL